MSKDARWLVKLGLALVAASALLYGMHYLIFNDAHHIFIYLVGDIAFVPIEVLMVTLILHRLLEVREKQAMMEKLNMVIGAFYSELGRPLIELMVPFDSDIKALREHMCFEQGWDAKRFAVARKAVEALPQHIDASQGDLVALRDFLHSRRDFTLSLLANPNLLEHESFTGLLWSVLHLEEELMARSSLEGLPTSDIAHLSGDIQRAYHNVLADWTSYLGHLSAAYPYLYSLAVRQNPLVENRGAEVTA
ncbi:MAG: hypothetical protein ACYC6C_08785 [Coriobacteriia bacterium]